MSSIYIQEPPTHGKVLLKTSFGDVDIELWPRETPKACRNFVQLCMEGFYDGIIFHRVIKKFIAQTGDPTGTGCTSVSIYGEPFKDEIHSRLRFTRRGLVALANNGKNDNGSQFFITLGPASELQGKHTIFGKVVGDTQYNILKLDEVLVDEDDRPIYETKILKTVILDNPFPDIVPRILEKPKEQETKPKESKKKDKGVKNYKLLSFGEEAEEDDLETLEEAKKFEGKSKSTHDVLNDPKFSSQTMLDMKTSDDEKDKDRDEELAKQVETVKNKLSKKSREEKSKPETPKSQDVPTEDLSDDDNYFESQREKEKNRKLESIRSEIKNLKREYRDEQKSKQKEDDAKKKKTEDKSEILKQYEEEREKYQNLKKQINLKGSAREDFTLSMLKKFTDTLSSTRTTSSSLTTEEVEDEEKNPAFNEWANTQLQTDIKQVLAKDANTKSDDWYEIFDPRNPITKRRRETNKQEINERRKAKYDLK